MWLKSLNEWKAKGIPCAIITIVKAEGSTPRHAGATMVVSKDGDIAGSVGGGMVEYECMKMVNEVISTNQPILKEFSLKGETEGGNGLPCGGICGGSVSVFIEPVVVKKELVIFGAGHIAEKLGKFCDILDLPYRVYDDRKEYLTQDRFPKATELVHAEFPALNKTITLGAASYCVILTYGHTHDEVCLEQLVQNKNLPYIGMIGSPKKVSVIVENLKSRGIALDNRVYSPVGLCIGRNLPQDIALSILSEIMLLMEGGSLKHFRIINPVII
jgi:xanthine dehydrogenase accessory factor